VLRLPRARDGFFTLGTLLRSQGYRTQYIYGGGANFDNMRAFFLANGFDQIIEQKDYPAPGFVASWGVSDLDLMERAHQEFLAHGEEPFLGVILSSTNHDPFEIPDGVIQPYNQPLYTRENAIRFADHAVGRFFELARSAPYWQDTVFLVVADHDARVEGAELLPLRHFRIPGVIIGPGVPVGPWPRIASQIDLAPTLLGLIGVDAPTPMIGRDLLDLTADAPGRALMQYDATHGLLVGDRLVLHQPDRAPATFRVEGDDLMPIATDPELARDARAHALWSYETYRRRAYRTP
jgi:phosphoglycerol transferase MdoB-like AlkP superfamily enzyme